jgi:predicted amidohydrolase
MNGTFRIALANLGFPTSPEASVVAVEQALARAASERARIVCFPECFVPGYRGAGKSVPPPDPAFLEAAWARIESAAKAAGVAAIVGTERVVEGRLLASALVVGDDGPAFQDKVQVDPSEDNLYTPGEGRRVFTAGPLTFGVVICHEGWRYPETVRFSARRGAQVVFHLQFSEAEASSHRPSNYGEAANSFHEKAVLCRAAENTCYFATVNYASAGSPTTSAVAGPDGILLCSQPYGEPGLLIADLDLSLATGLLAKRYRPID